MDFIQAASGFSGGSAAWRAASRLQNLRMNAVLLPTTGGSTSGLGLGMDMYDAVAKQTQGLYTGGRSAMNAAYAVLGIDRSQSFSRTQDTAEAETELETEAEVENREPGGNEPEAEAEPARRNITDELLKASGYVKPEANPWEYRTDFFA